MANKQTTRTVNLVVNGRKSEVSMNELRTAVLALNKSFNKLNEADDPALYAKKRKELMQLSQTYREMRSSVSSFAQSNRSFLNDFKSIAAGVLGGNLITGAIQGGQQLISKSIDKIVRKSDELSDVQKTTGLTLEEVKALNKELGKIDTRTGRSDLLAIAEVGGRFGIAEEELLGFVRAADKAGVALGDVFAGGAEEVATKLSRLQSLFAETKDLGVEESFNRIGSALNEIGANYRANEGYVVNFATRVGNLPGKLKPSITDAIALGAAFQESGLEANNASRAYSIFLKQGIANLPEFATAMNISIEEATKLMNTDPTSFFVKFSEATKGMEATDLGALLQDLGVNADGANKIIGAMSNNTERFAEIQRTSNSAFEEGISLTNEFNIKNENAAGRYEKSVKKMNAALKPYMQTIGNLAISFISFVANNVKGIMNIVKVLTVGAAAWGTYKLVVIATTKQNWLFLKSLVAQINTHRLHRLAMLAGAAAQALFTGNLGKAAKAMRLFNMITRLNPIGLIVSAIAAAGVAIAIFSSRVDEASRKQRELNNLKAESKKAIAGEVSEMERLVRIAENENLSKETRRKAIERLNRISPEYLGNLTLENIKTKEGTKALKDYVKMLQMKATVKAAETKLQEIATKRIELETNGVEEQITWYEKLMGVSGVARAAERTANLHKELNDQEQIFVEAAKKAQVSIEKALGSDAVVGGDESGNEPTYSPSSGTSSKDKKLEEIQRGFAQIERDVKKHRDNVAILNADEDAKEIEKINQKYQNQLIKLQEYNEKILLSDELTEQERQILKATYDALEIELLELHDAEIQALEDRQNAERIAKEKENAEELRQALMTDEEREIERVMAYYARLEELADGNSETLQIIAQRREDALSQISKRGKEEQLRDSIEMAKLEQSIATDLAGVLVQIANNTAKQGEEMTEFQKAAAIIQVIVNQGIALSRALANSQSPTPDNLATGGLAGLAKFAVISSSILSTVGQLKNILSDANTPTAPQFYGGGMTVRGEQDGRRYSARPIGSIAGGGRINQTSLGLLGERGTEFVVPNNVYTHPANANLMNALESTVTTAASGGSAAVGGGQPNAEKDQALTKAVYKLIAKLDEPIHAKTYFDHQAYEESRDLREKSRKVALYG